MRRITLCSTGCTTKAAALAAVAAAASIASQYNVLNNNYSARRALTMKLIHTEETPNVNITSQISNKKDSHIVSENVKCNKEENVHNESSQEYDENSSVKTGKKRVNSYTSSYNNSKVMPYHKVSRGRLAIIRPDLIDEWIPELNAVDVTSVPCSSHVNVWWRCKMCKNKYSAAIRERVVKESRCCPYCHGTGKMVVSDNETNDNNVDHHFSESEKRTFSGNDVKANADEEVKSKERASNAESKLTTESANTSVAEKSLDSLATSHPYLVKYWDVVKNGSFTPEMFNANSLESVWWTTPYPLDHYSTNNNYDENSVQKANKGIAETDKKVSQFVTFRRPIASFIVDQMSLQEKLERNALLEEELLDIVKKAASMASLSSSSSALEKPELCEEEKNEKEILDMLSTIYKQYTESNVNRSNGSSKENGDCSDLALLGTNILEKEHSSIIDWWSKQEMPHSSSVSDLHRKNKKQSTHSILHADELCFVNSPQGNKLCASRVRGALREELLNKYVQSLASLQEHSLFDNENRSFEVNVPLLLLLANTEVSNTSMSDDKNTKEDDDSVTESKSCSNVKSKLESLLQSIFAKHNKLSDVNVENNAESTTEGKESQSTKTNPVMSFTSLKLPNAATLHRSFPQLPSSLFNFTPSSSASASSAMSTEQVVFPSTSSLQPESSVAYDKSLLHGDDMSNTSIRSSQDIHDIIHAIDSSNEKKQYRSAFAITNENEEVSIKYPHLRKWMPRLFDKSLFTEDAPVETIFAQPRRQSVQTQQGSRLTDEAMDEFTNRSISTSYMQQQQQQQRKMNRRNKNFILFSDPAEMWDDEPLLAEYHRATFVSEHDPRIKFYHDAEEGDIDLASQLRVSGVAHDTTGPESVQTKVYDKRSLVGDAMAALGNNPTLEEDLKALSYVREVMQEVRYPDYRSINIHSVRNDQDGIGSDGSGANVPGSSSSGPRRTQGKPRTFRLQLPAAPLPVSLQTLEAPREPRKVARRKKRASVDEAISNDNNANDDSNDEN